jgi:midasin
MDQFISLSLLSCKLLMFMLLPVYSDQEEEDMSATKKEVKSEKTEAPGKEGKGEKGRRDEPFDEKVDVDGEVVGTDSVSRGGACTFHTQPLEESSSKQLTPEEVQVLREQLEQQLATWTTPPAGPEAVQAWSQFSAATSGLARDLCEQLRLVLEPTQAARLKGDYRTGRRINMRKVCPDLS